MTAFVILRTAPPSNGHQDAKDATITEQQALIARLKYLAEVAQPARIKTLEDRDGFLASQRAAERNAVFDNLHMAHTQRDKAINERNAIQEEHKRLKVYAASLRNEAIAAGRLVFEQTRDSQAQLGKAVREIEELREITTVLRKDRDQIADESLAAADRCVEWSERVMKLNDELRDSRDDLRKALNREKAAKAKVKELQQTGEVWTLTNEQIEKAIGNGRVVQRW